MKPNISNNNSTWVCGSYFEAGYFPLEAGLVPTQQPDTTGVPLLGFNLIPESGPQQVRRKGSGRMLQDAAVSDSWANSTQHQVLSSPRSSLSLGLCRRVNGKTWGSLGFDASGVQAFSISFLNWTAFNTWFMKMLVLSCWGWSLKLIINLKAWITGGRALWAGYRRKSLGNPKRMRLHLLLEVWLFGISFFMYCEFPPVGSKPSVSLTFVFTFQPINFI